MFALALWLVAFVLLAREASADPFTPGSVVVLRANVSGEPGASLAAFLDEFTPTGDFLQTIDLPADNGPGLPAFSLSANDPYAGLMTRTSSREALLIVGYSVPAGTPKVEMSTSYITRRVVAIVWTNGTIDTSTLDVEEFGSDRKTPGFIRCAASDDMQDIWITGDSPNNPGGAVRIINRTATEAGQVSTAALVIGGGNFTGCAAYGDRLFAVSETDGGLYALEDLHSFEPGLPGAVLNPAFPATYRNVTAGPFTAGFRGPPGFALGGDPAAPKLWTASPTDCASAWAYDPAGTPSDYVFSWGYLANGMDLQTGPMTQEQARAACDLLRECAGFTFFFNQTQDGPYDPSRVAYTYLKGPLFYFTPTPENEPETWWTYQKPSPSGYFRFQSPQRAPRLCVGGTTPSASYALAASDDASTLFGTTTDGAELRRVVTAGSDPSVTLAVAPEGTRFFGVAMSPAGAPSPAPSPSASTSASASASASVSPPAPPSKTQTRSTSRSPSTTRTAAPVPNPGGGTTGLDPGGVAAAVIVPLLVVGGVVAFALLRPQAFWGAVGSAGDAAAWAWGRAVGSCTGGGSSGKASYRFPSRVLAAGERAPLTRPNAYGAIGTGS